MEDKIHEETKALDEYRANRNKYQQNIQQIQALRTRIHIAEDKIKQMEMSRMNIDDIKAACTKEIKVCFFFFNSMSYFKNLYLTKFAFIFNKFFTGYYKKTITNV